MRVLLAFTAASVLAIASATGQSAVLWNADPPAPGTSLREETSIALETGTFLLDVNHQMLKGTANALVRDLIKRTYVSAAEQQIEVVDSARNIRFGFGNSNGKSEPKDTAGHLRGKKLTGRKVGDRWVFTLAGKQEPDSAESSALKQFAVYSGAVEALGLLYGDGPRTVGETWKPDVSAVTKTNPDINADLECKLEEIKSRPDDNIARISVTGRLTARIASAGSVQVAINGVIHRSLRDRIDLDTVVNGNFRYSGQFGKGGSNAEITAPVKLTRTVKIIRQ